MGGGSKSSIQTPECCLPLLNPYFLLQQCWVQLILINLLGLLLIQYGWYTIRNLSRVRKKCRHCQSCPGLQMGGVGWGSTPWWIFLWPWLDVPSCSLFFISHNTYSYTLCCILLLQCACAFSGNLPSCFSCSSCLPAWKGTSLPSPSFFSPLTIAVVPVKLKVMLGKARVTKWAKLCICANEAFDAVPWSFQSFFFFFPPPQINVSWLLADPMEHLFSGCLFIPAGRNPAVAPGSSCWGWLLQGDLETPPVLLLPALGFTFVP